MLIQLIQLTKIKQNKKYLYPIFIRTNKANGKKREREGYRSIYLV